MGNETHASLITVDSAALRSCGVFQVLIASVGILGNARVLAATVMSNVLRNKANILIALLAIADSLVCDGFFVVSTTTALHASIVFQCGVFDVLGLHNYFTLARCSYIELPFSAFFNMESTLMLVLGIDRLFAVVSPTR